MALTNASLIVLLGLVAACSDGGSKNALVPHEEQGRPAEAETVMIKIEPYLTGCMGVGPQSCMLLTRATEQVPRLFYGGIDGFEFEWGQRVVAEVEIERVAVPAADQSTQRYRLREVTSSVSVGPDERFSLRVYPDSVIWKEVDPGGNPEIQSLHGLPMVSCIDTEACAALRDHLVRPEISEAGVALQVGFPSGRGGALVIFEIGDSEKN